MRWAIILLLVFLAGCGGGGGESGSTGGSGSTNQYAASFKGTYLASSQSDKYHYPSCPAAQNILEVNLIGFSSEKQAVLAGYSPCQICEPPLGILEDKPTVSMSNVSPTSFAATAQPTIKYVSVDLAIADEKKNLQYLSCAFYKSDGSYSGYSNDFNLVSGVSSMLISPFHVDLDVSKAGTYDLKCTVQDRALNSSTATTTIVVQ